MSDDADGGGMVFCLAMDAAGVVTRAAHSNLPQPDMTEVPDDVYTQVRSFGIGRCTVAAGPAAADGTPTWTVEAHEPPPPPAPPREQLGNVFLRAVVDLGWWDFFEAGAARQASPIAQGGAGKPYDGRAWSTIGKTDRVLASDAPLARVARAAEAARVAASGQPAPAQPAITIAAAMDRGDAMLKAAG